MTFSIVAALVLATGQPATPPVAAKPVADPEKMVCKTIGETGSRLGGKRECKTRAEWERIAAEAKAKATSNMGR